jgi:hypothetical protein
MTGPEQDVPQPRARPNGAAWEEAQQDVARRNDLARKAGRAQRTAYERRQAAQRRAETERGVYR